MDNGDNMKHKNDKNFDDFYEFNTKKRKKKNKITKRDILLIILPLLFIPFLLTLIVISTHSSTLIKQPITYIIYCLLLVFQLAFLFGAFAKKKRKNSIDNVYNRCTRF